MRCDIIEKKELRLVKNTCNSLSENTLYSGKKIQGKNPHLLMVYKNVVSSFLWDFFFLVFCVLFYKTA